MHVLVVTDQHPESLGGVQVAIRLQRTFLERLGHRVTIAAPALHRRGYVPAAADRDVYIDLPSRPITKDREYGITWPGAATDRYLAARLRELPPVDLVHVQGDFWGAMIGIRAARGLRVPIVHTMHNNVDEGTRAVTRLAPAVFAALRLWRRLVLGAPRGPGTQRAGQVAPVQRAEAAQHTELAQAGTRPRGAWRYLAELAAEAHAVTAPSTHFATELQRHGVAALVEVTPGGVDDDAVTAAATQPRTDRARPRLIWLGRMSQEKRILEFIDAIAMADLDADVVLHGAGLLLPQVRERIVRHGLDNRVTIPGPVPYREALAAIRDADALVQTSLGFETQGLTPFEAAALGTPTVFCDPNIADDVNASVGWRVADASVAALAATLGIAVTELAAAPSPGLRVPSADGARFLQSTQTARMLEVFTRATAE